MTGLEKIIGQIGLDAEKACGQISAAAEAECEKIKADGEKRASERYEKLIAEARKKCSLEEEKANSGAKALVSRAVLAAKTEIISEVFTETLAKLRSLDTKEYFEALHTLIKRYAMDGEGELLMNKRDIDRMPDGFMKEFHQLSCLQADIEDGFILRYGGIEQNCTFEALLESEKDNIKDMLYKQLFV